MLDQGVLFHDFQNASVGRRTAFAAGLSPDDLVKGYAAKYVQESQHRQNSAGVRHLGDDTGRCGAKNAP